MLKKLLYKLRIAQALEQLQDIYYFRQASKQLENTLIGKPSLLKRIFNVLIIADQQQVFKIGYQQPNTVELEFNNVSLMLKHHPELKTIFPNMEYQFLNGWPCIVADKLSTPSNQQKPFFAENVLKVFASNAQLEHISLDKLPNVKSGIELCNQYLPKINCQALATTQLSTTTYKVGPCHGDFHSGNIMMRNDESAAIIDFDCMRLNSIQAFDALYYQNEELSAKTQSPWLECLCDALDKPDQVKLSSLNGFHLLEDSGLTLLYVLDRLGQQLKYGIIPDIGTLEETIIQLSNSIQESSTYA